MRYNQKQKCVQGQKKVVYHDVKILVQANYNKTYYLTYSIYDRQGSFQENVEKVFEQ